LPPTHPLSWQLSLSDAECDTVLSYHSTNTLSSSGSSRSFLRRGGAAAAAGSSGNSSDSDGGGGGEVSNDAPLRRQQELTDDSICPICQDDLSQDQLDAGDICFCESSCGSNIHIKVS
jgi:hypothetical protein